MLRYHTEDMTKHSVLKALELLRAELVTSAGQLQMLRLDECEETLDDLSLYVEEGYNLLGRLRELVELS